MAISPIMTSFGGLLSRHKATFELCINKRSWGWQDKFAYFFACTTKMESSPLYLVSVLLFLCNSKVAYWKLIFIVGINVWLVTFHKYIKYGRWRVPLELKTKKRWTLRVVFDIWQLANFPPYYQKFCLLLSQEEKLTSWNAFIKHFRHYHFWIFFLGKRALEPCQMIGPLEPLLFTLKWPLLTSKKKKILTKDQNPLIDTHMFILLLYTSQSIINFCVQGIKERQAGKCLALWKSFWE